MDVLTALRPTSWCLGCSSVLSLGGHAAGQEGGATACLVLAVDGPALLYTFPLVQCTRFTIWSQLHNAQWSLMKSTTSCLLVSLMLRPAQVWHHLYGDASDPRWAYGALPQATWDNGGDVSKLAWDVSPSMKEHIGRAERFMVQDVQDALDLKAIHFHDYGKRAIKSWGLSPDATLQMAFQLAYVIIELNKICSRIPGAVQKENVVDVSKIDLANRTVW